jgi:hypothetical protein
MLPPVAALLPELVALPVLGLVMLPPEPGAPPALELVPVPLPAPPPVALPLVPAPPLCAHETEAMPKSAAVTAALSTLTIV